MGGFSIASGSSIYQIELHDKVAQSLKKQELEGSAFEIRSMFQLFWNDYLSLRSSYNFRYESAALVYESAGQLNHLSLSHYTHSISLPLVIDYQINNVQPFFLIGPQWQFYSHAVNTAFNPIKQDWIWEIATGIEFNPKSQGTVISIGLKWGLGTGNILQNQMNQIGLHSIQRNYFLFTLEFRNDGPPFKPFKSQNGYDPRDDPYRESWKHIRKNQKEESKNKKWYEIYLY